MTKTTLINMVKATMLDGYTPVNKLKNCSYFTKCLQNEISRIAFEAGYEITITEENEIIEAVLS